MERLRTDFGYNLDLLDRDDCGPDGMPEMAAPDIDQLPDRLVRKPDVKRTSTSGKPKKGIPPWKREMMRRQVKI